MRQVGQYYVYILANKPYGTLYTGVTSVLLQRTYQHKNKFVAGFSEKYGANQLVYYESTDDIESAIVREKQIKKWNRHWKFRLINEFNPRWRDLYRDLVDKNGFPPARE
ncbi:MAG: GIY-YIG nuclease family protein [Patescibacteria group bacterium]